VELIVDQDHLGRSEAQWESLNLRRTLAPLGEFNAERLIVVAPHPDDEVLGAGGLIQVALARDIPLEIIAVTDGEASHPSSKVTTARELADLRSRESEVALGRLGWGKPIVTRLHLPDGKVQSHRKELKELLTERVRFGDVCVAPWRRDGHPDHDACGEEALAVSHDVNATVLEYLVWAWHWADPTGNDIPWASCQRLDLSRAFSARKRWSTAAFESQLLPRGPDSADAPVLPPLVMRRFWRDYEVYVNETLVA
jgi:LmbE family N-acetylglucosaminyl deacetylase